jgi:uncharacterized membrane protein
LQGYNRRVTAMNRLLVVLTFVLLLPNVAGAQPPEWTLVVETRGAPWEAKFQVTLNHTGALSVIEDDPIKKPASTISKLAVNLSPGDIQAAYEQALKAFREFQLTKDTEVRDGTDLTMSLTVKKRRLTMQVFNFGLAEEDLPEVAKLLTLLNKYLPEEHHIY